MKFASPPVGNPKFLSVVAVPLFTPDECDAILEMSEDRWKPASVTGYGDDPASGVRPDTRSVLTQRLPLGEDGWALRRLSEAVTTANADVFRFNLTTFLNTDPPSLLRYESNAVDHFQAHRDVGPDFPTRKLSCVVQLSDPGDYRGGSLVFPEERTIAQTERGTMTLFPSFLIHQVTPVVAGVRHVIVAWVHGPTFA